MPIRHTSDDSFNTGLPDNYPNGNGDDQEIFGTHESIVEEESDDREDKTLEQHRSGSELDHIMGAVKLKHLETSIRNVLNSFFQDEEGLHILVDLAVGGDLRIPTNNLIVGTAPGEIGLGIGIRTAGRAELYLMSDGEDTPADIFFGHDSATSADGNFHWGISSRGKAGHALNIYRAPGHTGGPWEIAGSFHETGFDVSKGLRVDDGPFFLRDLDSNGATTNTMFLGSSDRIAGVGGRYDLGIFVSTGANPRVFRFGTPTGSTGTIQVRADHSFSAPQFFMEGSSTAARWEGLTNSWGSFHRTSHGYIRLGPANTGWAHIYTDRPGFYFNKDISGPTSMKVYRAVFN